MTDINPTDEFPVAPRRRGRPPGSGRKAVQAPVREAMASPVQEGARVEYKEDGRAVYITSDGTELTRKRTTNSDIFHVPPEIIPPGWDYQWNTVTVYNEPQVAAQLNMAENGWRPVPAGRHKGRFMPYGTSDNAEILRDGLRLEERPTILNEEAKREELLKAQRQMSDQIDQHQLSSKMPDGFSRENHRLRAAERKQTSRAYAPAPDIARPRYQMEE